jgi:hypothetical protein
MARSGAKGRLALIVIVTLACLPRAGPSAAQTSLESSVKANYLVRFTAFIDWPGWAFHGAQSPIAICVLGPDPFGAVNRRLKGTPYRRAIGTPL